MPHRFIQVWLIPWLFLELTAGAAFDQPASAQERVRAVFMVDNGWHAALVVRTADISTSALPELGDFPQAEYLEISWGDAEYFPDRDAGFFGALKAAFWSSGSVIHVVGFSGSVEKAYPGAEIIEIAVAEDRFDKMLRYLSDDFLRPAPTAPAKASPGLFPNSRFYAARSQFSALRTCNTWIAEALRAAGLPLKPWTVVSAGNLAQQVKPYGIQRSSP
jgi:uncharacterized protein (TIGR02117 family)